MVTTLCDLGCDARVRTRGCVESSGTSSSLDDIMCRSIRHLYVACGAHTREDDAHCAGWHRAWWEQCAMERAGSVGFGRVCGEQWRLRR